MRFYLPPKEMCQIIFRKLLCVLLSLKHLQCGNRTTELVYCKDRPANLAGPDDGATCSHPVSPPWPPSSHFPIALRVKVQELAPAIAQRTDQWAWSCIDRATWAPEVPANPCSLSATLAVGGVFFDIVFCWTDRLIFLGAHLHTLSLSPCRLYLQNTSHTLLSLPLISSSTFPLNMASTALSWVWHLQL